MPEIDLVFRTMFAELGQRCIDAQFVRDFRLPGSATAYPASGGFVRMAVKGRDYWYHQSTGPDGRRRKAYVGPAADPEITGRVEEFTRIADDLRGRRKLVSTLVREARLPAPEPFTGDVVEALAGAGLFRLRGVLVGTVAFQCYPGLLGVRLPSASLQTGDADFAQFHSISVAVGDSIPPVTEVLREVDGSFREIPSQGDPRRTAQFEARNRYRVEFLTPNRGGDEHQGRPATMPALGGAGAVPLRFLDFLIRDPVRSVMLHRSGVSVTIPSPERYAIHKLIVASRRMGDGNGALKREKDVRQASILRKVLAETRGTQAELADAYAEAWDRGPAWRDGIVRGLSYMAAVDADAFREAIATGLADLRLDPSSYGLAGGGPRP